MPDDIYDINSVKTNIALIQKDIKQIENIFGRVETAITQMSKIQQTIAVQENILVNNEKRISSLEEKVVNHHAEELVFRKDLSTKLEDMRKVSHDERAAANREILESINKISASIDKKFSEQDKKITDQDKKIESLEKWRWYLLGAGAVILLVINKFPWDRVFGG